MMNKRMVSSGEGKDCGQFLSVRILLLSLFTLLVHNLYQEHGFFLKDRAHIPSNIAYFLYVYVLISLLLYAFHGIGKRNGGGVLLSASKLEGMVKLFAWNRKNIVRTALIIFAVTVLHDIIWYPGQVQGDTFLMIQDYITGMQPLKGANWASDTPYFLNAHHPIVDTALYSWFYKLGEAFGSANAGIFTYSLLQGLAGSFCCSLMLCSLTLLNVPAPYISAGFLYIVLLPYIPVYLTTVMKDSTNGICFILYYTVFVHILVRGGSRKKWAVLMISALLVTLTKQTGIYIVTASTVFLLFEKQLRRNWKSILLCTVIPVLVWFVIFPKIVYPAVKVRTENIHEALGVPFQQMALTVIEHEDELSEEEKETIGRVLDYEKIKTKFRYDLTDPVKNTYNGKASGRDVAECMKLWVKLGIRHPKTYLSALAGTCGRYFVPDMNITPVNYTFTNQMEDRVHLYVPENWKAVRQFFAEIYSALVQTPILNILFAQVISAFWLPLYVFCLAIRRRSGKTGLAAVPVYLSVLCLLLSPHAVNRYAAQLIFTLPMTAGLAALLDCSGKRVSDSGRLL